MKTTTAWAILVAGAACAAWIGCSSSSGGASTADAGASDANATDAGADATPSDAAPDAEASTTLPVSCENYCSLVTLNCTGQNAVYTSKDTCLGICAKMTLGAAGDTVDSVGCRQGFAATAQGNPSTICPRAGLTGADSCGARCAAFCKLDIALCAATAYADEAACETACLAMPYAKSSGDVAQTGAPNADTLNCRIYHLEAAYANDAGLSSLHCPHTATPSTICKN